jgi:hypothetical protein
VADFSIMGNNREALFYLSKLRKYATDLFGVEVNAITDISNGSDPTLELQFSVAIVDRFRTRLKVLSGPMHSGVTQASARLGYKQSTKQLTLDYLLAPP